MSETFDLLFRVESTPSPSSLSPLSLPSPPYVFLCRSTFLVMCLFPSSSSLHLAAVQQQCVAATAARALSIAQDESLQSAPGKRCPPRHLRKAEDCPTSRQKFRVARPPLCQHEGAASRPSCQSCLGMKLRRNTAGHWEPSML